MLAPYRKLREEKIDLDEEIKAKIIKVVDKIPVKIDTDVDWSILVEFKLTSKTHKILGPRLESYTDGEYRCHFDDSLLWFSMDQDNVKLEWMRWDDVDEWENQKLKEYVKGKEAEWLHMPKIEEMRSLLEELWK